MYETKRPWQLFQFFAVLAVWTVILLAIAGCSGGNGGGQAKADMEAIYNRYPELKNRTYDLMTVKRVVDGDTFETDKKEKVRLIGVNTPESVKPKTPVEYLAKEASSFTKERLTGKTVIAFADTESKDKYGRLLRYIFIKGESVMYNETLVAEGYANVMTVPPNVMFSKHFVKLEKEAREAKKGLWADESPNTKKTK